VKQDAYPTEVSRLQADMLAQSEVVRFDGSDLMRGAVGTGSFWTGVMDYVGGENLDDVLAEIEASWPTE
jgi:alpha-glucoside transport system substrate-binding protein